MKSSAPPDNSTGLAIIICTWNRARLLAETLVALNALTRPETTRVEVVVVDNNSSDETRQVVEAMATGRPEDRQHRLNFNPTMSPPTDAEVDPIARPAWTQGRLHYVFEARQGKQFALNRGIAAAADLNCDWMAFTDDDILFDQAWLTQLTLAARLSQGPCLMGGKTKLLWPEAGPPPWYDPRMSAVLGGIDQGDARLHPAPVQYTPAGANLIANRALLEQIGTFSELHYRHMDYEFGRRAQSRGLALTYEPSLVVYAPVDAKVLTQRYFRRWAFKAGFEAWSSRERNMSHWLWVPRWVWWQMCCEAWAWLNATLTRAPEAEKFYLQFQLARRAGLVASRWISRWRPQAYDAWVQRYAQKKANLF